MKTVLDQIVNKKEQEIKSRMQQFPIEMMRESVRIFPLVSFEKLLSSGVHFISEFKRKSPGGGFFTHPSPGTIAPGYVKAGASAVSILTDEVFFGGSMDDLRTVKDLVSLPVLRKDFILYEYQIYESYYSGADIVLLIAACLSPTKIFRLAKLGRELGMEILLEVRSEKEIRAGLNEYVNIIGVNNRDLHTLKTDTDISRKLRDKIPPGIPCISESGLSSPVEIAELHRAGYAAFLIGESLIRKDDPASALRTLINETNQLLGTDKSLFNEN